MPDNTDSDAEIVGHRILEGRCPRCGRPLATRDGQHITNAGWPPQIAARMFCGDCGEERSGGHHVHQHTHQ
jgi:hypothetical protein